MRRKINALIITLVMCSTSMAALFVVHNDVNVKANPEESGDIKLDGNLIYNVTQYLSNIINTAYNNNELYKGRAFGSKGEWNASDYIKDNMNALGLFNVHKEQIVDIPPDVDLLPSQNSRILTTKLDILTMGLTVNHSGILSPTDCYISPRWNDSIDDENYNKNDLSYNCTNNNLKIIKTDNYSCTDAFLQYVYIPEQIPLIPLIPPYLPSWNNFMQDMKLALQVPSGMETAFEDYYDFHFNTITPNDNSTFPSFLKNQSIPNYDFVFIQENPKFNPNIKELPSIEYDQNYNGLYQWTFLIKNQFERLQWKVWEKVYPHCQGLIRYDYDNLSYDTGQRGSYFPVIYINGSIGKTIYNQVEDYQINYFVNQQWNTSVISYNVIGQINGKDPTKTVIIGCLYDCMWNQGTVDSAIGIGIMLALAKYLKTLQTNYGIIPDYTTKFIAYGGEEYGMIGAYHYEATHLDENIRTVIDLNQVGYQINSSSIFYIASNSLTPLFNPDNNILERLADTFHYKDRTDGITDLSILPTPVGSVSDESVFAQARLPSFLLGGHDRLFLNTIMFLKDTAWYRHHRTGMNYTEGDVMKYYNDTDVAVTSEMVLNVTKYFTVDPHDWFQPNSVSVELADLGDDQDTNPDSVIVHYTLITDIPNERATIRAFLDYIPFPLLFRFWNKEEYILNPETNAQGSIIVSLPKESKEGWYRLTVYLHDSNGDIDVSDGLEFYLPR
ncbi:MAG: M28 family peptidase [Euryarchaeota archaeon]|nr:M28 family peptidase [Euryarchaeota archaeon]